MTRFLDVLAGALYNAQGEDFPVKADRNKAWYLVIGFGAGVILSGLVAALVAELKHFIEQGRAGRIFEFLPAFDEQFGGNLVKPTSEKMLDEMIELAQLDEGVRTRRLFREGNKSDLGGEGDAAIYFEEE